MVAIGPAVAFVDVSGKGEATIEIGELKNADGELTLSRKLARGAVSDLYSRVEA